MTAALLVALATAAAPAGDAAGSHFTFDARGPDELLVPYLAAALEDERSRAVASGAAAAEKLQVVITPDRRDLSRLVAVDAGPAVPAACGHGKLVLVSPRAAAGGYPWLEAARREYARCAASPEPAGKPAAFQLRWKGEPPPKGGSSTPEPARDFARLGDILLARGRSAPARIEYEKAIRRGGGDPDVVARWALAALSTGGAADVEGPLRDAARDHPHHAGVHAALGRLELSRERWPAARDAFVAAFRVNPFDADVHAGLAVALENLGDATGASREKKNAEMLRR